MTKTAKIRVITNKYEESAVSIALMKQQLPTETATLTEQAKVVASSFLEIYDAVNQATSTADYALIVPNKVTHT